MKANKSQKLPKKPLTKKQRDNLVGYSFIGIWLVGFVLFMLYPFINSIVYSFSDVRIMGTGIQITFSGLKNFQNIFQIDQGFVFLEALWSFVQDLILQVPIIIVFSIIIAILLNQPIKGRGLFRVIFFLPVIISSGPVISELTTQGAGGTNLMEQYGFISLIQDVLSERFATPIIGLFSEIIIIFWFSGVQILIMLAGIQKIDRQIYEAAKVDGASPWESFWKITLPSLKSLIFINIIYTIVLLATFSENPVIVAVKSNMFDLSTGYGMASAMSWVYMIVISIFIALVCLIFIPRNNTSKRGGR